MSEGPEYKIKRILIDGNYKFRVVIKHPTKDFVEFEEYSSISDIPYFDEEDKELIRASFRDDNDHDGRGPG